MKTWIFLSCLHCAIIWVVILFEFHQDPNNVLPKDSSDRLCQYILQRCSLLINCFHLNRVYRWMIIETWDSISSNELCNMHDLSIISVRNDLRWGLSMILWCHHLLSCVTGTLTFYKLERAISSMSVYFDSVNYAHPGYSVCLSFACP